MFAQNNGRPKPFEVSVGFYHGGDVGEVFIAGSKSGTDFDGVCRDSAVLLSLALQYGVSLETIGHAVTRNSDGSPSTIVGRIVDELAKKANA